MSYIVPMDKPNCFNCCFRTGDYCGILTENEKVKEYAEHYETSKFCPLVEIPTPHGRLGDLDALYEEISNGNKAYNGIEGYDGEYPNIANVDDCLEAIKYAETVIEGSET